MNYPSVESYKYFIPLSSFFVKADIGSQAT